MRWLLFGLVMLSCGGASQVAETPKCDVDELLVDGVCRHICANQFHCWSNCCLPVATDAGAADAGTDGYVWHVCMEEELCYGPLDAQ